MKKFAKYGSFKANKKLGLTYEEGKALIAVYQNRKEEYFRTRNKPTFWRNVLTDLEAMNVLVFPTTSVHVENKWKTLYRAYKNAKDRETETSPSKFLYMEEMEAIFHNSPVVSSQHSVSVGVNLSPVPAEMSNNNWHCKPKSGGENRKKC